MCGRYVLVLQTSEIRHRLERDGLDVHSSPPDTDSEATNVDLLQTSSVQKSYNIAPTYTEPIYRAIRNSESPQAVEYQLVPAKWGLIFNWGATKTSFGQVPKTINCRDDSLLRTSGLWNSVKHQRCIVPAQGFYEWLNTGKEKCPHYVKPANGTDLFYFAGLWNSHMDAGKTIITFTIITTSSSEQLRFLHDRMPVILCEPDTIRTWLDGSVRWSMDLQKLLKPLGDDACISCYPVAKEVGKVGRSEKRFTEKLEPKAGIASFFKQKDQKKDIGAVKREAADISASEDDPKRLVLETNVPLGVKVEMKDEDKEPVTKVNHEAEPEKEEIDSMHKRARIGSSTEKSPRKISRPSSPSRMKRRPRTANGNQKITSFFFKGPIS